MSWIAVALLAYLFLAIANLFDKFLIDNVLNSSKAYAFVACVLGAVVVVIAPWFLVWPGWFFFLWNIFTGFIFALALWFLYEALRQGEAARILVFVGGVTPVFSIALSVLFLKESFTTNQWIGFLFLIIGVFIIAFLPSSRSFLARVLRKLRLSQRIEKNGLRMAFFSGLAYAFYFVASKYAFNNQPFASAFIWGRIGAALFVLLFLIRASDRQQIKRFLQRSTPGKNKLLVFLGQLLGSSGFILQNYAIFLGSVALVNALQGVQYAFILVISAGLALMAPRLLKENFSWPIILQKSVAVLVIGVGLYFIAF